MQNSNFGVFGMVGREQTPALCMRDKGKYMCVYIHVYIYIYLSIYTWRCIWWICILTVFSLCLLVTTSQLVSLYIFGVALEWPGTIQRGSLKTVGFHSTSFCFIWSLNPEIVIPCQLTTKSATLQQISSQVWPWPSQICSSSCWRTAFHRDVRSGDVGWGDVPPSKDNFCGKWRFSPQSQNRWHRYQKVGFCKVSL